MHRLSGPPPPLAPRPWYVRALPGIILYTVAVALRVLYATLATGPGAVPSSDPAEYDEVAWNLARGVGFMLGSGASAYPTAFVPPVVPWITSLLYRIVGHDYVAALIVQCFVGATVPLLVRRLGQTLFGGPVGSVAGWLAAFHPLLIFFSGYLLTETAFSAAMMAALVATAEWVRTPRRLRALGAGVLWGLASLARPTALLLPAFMALWAWGPLGLALRGRERLGQIALLILGLVIVVSPWTFRNMRVFGTFVPVTTGSGRALLHPNNPMAWDDPVHRGGAYIDFDAEPWASIIRGGTEPERDARARAAAWAFMRERVHQWPEVAVAKVRRFWRLTAEGGGTGSWQRPGSPLHGILSRVDPFLVWSLVVMPLALWGIVQSLRGPRRRFQALPLGVIVYFTLLAVVFWGALRMRVPAEPLVVTLSAVGFEDLRRRMKTLRVSRLSGA